MRGSSRLVGHHRFENPTAYRKRFVTDFVADRRIAARIHIANFQSLLDCGSRTDKTPDHTVERRPELHTSDRPQEVVRLDRCTDLDLPIDLSARRSAEHAAGRVPTNDTRLTRVWSRGTMPEDPT